MFQVVFKRGQVRPFERRLGHGGPTGDRLTHLNQHRCSVIIFIENNVLVGGLEHDFYFPHILGMSSSQLTMIFQRD